MPYDYESADTVSGSTANQGCVASENESKAGKTSSRVVKDVNAGQVFKDGPSDMGPSGKGSSGAGRGE